MRDEYALSLIPDVAKAVKTAFPFHPNQDDDSRDALLRSAFLGISSRPAFGHGGNAAVVIPSVQLP